MLAEISTPRYNLLLRGIANCQAPCGKTKQTIFCATIVSNAKYRSYPIYPNKEKNTKTTKKIYKIHYTLGLTCNDGNAHAPGYIPPDSSYAPSQSIKHRSFNCLLVWLPSHLPLPSICENSGNTNCSPFAHNYGSPARLRDYTGFPYRTTQLD